MTDKLNVCDFGERFEKILEYWLKLKNNNNLPSWNNFDIKNAAYCIGFLNAISVIDDGKDFEYRVFGTSIVDAYSSELTRKRVSEVTPADRSRKSMKLYQTVVKTAQPHCVFQDISDIKALKPLYGEEDKYWLRLVFPFSTDGKAVDRLLGYGAPISLKMFEAGMRQRGLTLHDIYPVQTDLG